MKLKSGIPRSGKIDKEKAATSTSTEYCHIGDMDVYTENQFLGCLVKDMQAKLSLASVEVNKLSDDARTRESAFRGLQSQHEVAKKQIADLQKENKALHAANASLAEEHDIAQVQKAQAGCVVVDLNLQMQDKITAAAQLQERCNALERQLQEYRASGVTAEQVSQQLQRVETMYRSRLEAVKEDCREKLAAQEGAARVRLAEAQAATTQMLASVKRAAVREVQRAEALLNGKAMDQMRVLDQLAKRCRALEARIADMQPLATAAREARGHVAELEHRLREAADAAAAAVAARSACGGCCAGCCACSSSGGGSGSSHCTDGNRAHHSAAAVDVLQEELAGLQQRLVATRGEVANQVELVAQLQSDVVTAQQQRVAGEERLQAVEATCRELRADNVTLRAQLLGELAPEPARQREAAAHVSALRAAESDAATRDALQSARREQVATSLALLSQLRRMQALEAMRLRDLQEIHQLERQLASWRRERMQSAS